MTHYRTRTALSVVLPLLVGLPVPGVAAQPSVRVSANARFDAVINRAIADKRIVGTVVIVMQNGKEVYRRAAGIVEGEAG